MRIPRIFKQTFYMALYLAIIISLIYLIVQYFQNQPTCNDGKKNQNETGVDCGGVCSACPEENPAKNLTVPEKSIVPAGINKYDLVAKVANPNSNIGSPSFDYQFVIKNQSGGEIGRRSGRGFILPAENKYILEIGFDSQDTPASADLIINNVTWEKFSGYEEPDLAVTNVNFNEITSGVGFYEVKGLLRNESAFDFSLITMKIIMRDSSGKIIAVNKSEMRTINSKEERDFRQVWPNRFSGSVSKVEIDPEADVYNNETFLQHYLPTKDTQQYQYKTQR
jgi:hypothetical protein